MIPEEVARRERLQKIKEDGKNPYPAKANRSHMAQDVLDSFEALEKSNEAVTVAGRLTAKRKHGGLTFLLLKDTSGTIQTVLHRDAIGTEEYNEFHEESDVGDFYEFTGTAFRTRKGEPSVQIQTYRLLTKTLLPLPEKWHGLTDIEKRYRWRYLDLISNEQAMQVAKARSRMVLAIRNFLAEEDFMEVETPVLQPIAGGAAARPFTTHHNSLDHDFFLRIAPELYLKRLLVGGFEKVYEFSRCFRNEGVSPQHNPEFTQIEGYWAYATIDDLLKHIEGMIEAAVKAVTGSLTVEAGEVTLDFTAPFKRMSFHDAIEKESGIDLDQMPDEESLRSTLKEKGMHVDDIIGIGELIDHLWKTEVRPKMIQPTFITDYPASMKPLAKVRDDNPNYSEGAQLLVNGMEVMNAFNEQNDPLAQEAVFEEQERLREQGSEEAQMVDDDYVKALKHGMPPAAGYGIGIDRLAMLLTNSPNIKEVILFPTLKPAANKEDETQ